MIPDVPTAAVIANPRIAAELGHLGDWLEENSFSTQRLIRDDVLDIDAADHADVLIVMGSIWTLADGHRTEEHRAAIDAEVELVRGWVRENRPMLGICFGGQVLSASLGGTVERMPIRVLGWETPASDLPVLRAPWALWHEDRFSIPAGTDALAVTPHAPMALRSHRAWGLQFHPEFTPDIMRGIAHDLGTPQAQAEPLISLAEQRHEQQRAESHALFDSWWAEVRA